MYCLHRKSAKMQQRNVSILEIWNISSAILQKSKNVKKEKLKRFKTIRRPDLSIGAKKMCNNNFK